MLCKFKRLVLNEDKLNKQWVGDGNWCVVSPAPSSAGCSCFPGFTGTGKAPAPGSPAP